jgi:lysophospholipase L1-like esterase
LGEQARSRRVREQSLIRTRALGAVSALLGLAVVLVVMEGLLRLTDLAPNEGVATVTEAEFRLVPGLLAPNQGLVDTRKPALRHHVQINGLGYRGPDLAWNKAPGETRLLMVGDSFTYGEFVNDDETLPARLERELGRYCTGVRVINAGIGGTTIDTQSQMVERALPLRPDVVILTFSENDLVDLDGPSAWDQLAANRKRKSNFPLSIAYPVLKRLALWHFALDVRARLRAHGTASAAGPDAPESFRKAWRAASMRQLGAYAEALTKVRGRLRAQGVEFILVLFPSHLSLRKGGSTEQLEWLMRIGAETGITTVNLFAPLADSGQPLDRLYLLPHDGHPSAQGYAVAAAFLAGKLARDRMLQGACGQER